MYTRGADRVLDTRGAGGTLNTRGARGTLNTCFGGVFGSFGQVTANEKGWKKLFETGTLDSMSFRLQLIRKEAAEAGYPPLEGKKRRDERYTQNGNGIEKTLRVLLLAEPLFKKLDKLTGSLVGILAFKLQGELRSFGSSQAHHPDNRLRIDLNALHFDEKIGLETRGKLDNRCSRPGVQACVVFYDDFLNNHGFWAVEWINVLL
jgi:hypothetical protein